jgi:aspartyl aminopeptidase
VVDFECSLYDTQPAAISGAANEFLCSSRLDNLASCHVATQALVAHASDADKLAADPDVSLIALFDHEEVTAPNWSRPLPNSHPDEQPPEPNSHH